MARIFLSYNRSNLDAVKTLVQDLEAAGDRVWFDQALTGGHRWWADILANIRESEVFVFALTPESLESHACKQELVYAGQLGKPILPILLSDGVDMNLLPRPLGEIQLIDCREQHKHSLLTLVKAIKSLPAPVPLPDPLPQPPPVPVSYFLSDLKEQVDTPERIDFEQQIALVFKLRDCVGEGWSHGEVRHLLLRLKKRDDLLAKVGNEIDAVLNGIKEHSPGAPRNPRFAAAPEPLAHRTERRSSPQASETEEPIAFDCMDREIGRILNRVLDDQETWVLELDQKNHIVVNADRSEAARIISAKAKFRDNVWGSKQQALKTLGWNVKGEGWKGAMGGAVLYATSGLGALALASGKVRDYLMKGVAIRDWPVTASRREVATITEELEVALQKIAPDAKAVVVRPFSPESWNKGIESSPAETLGRVGRVEHARRELSPGSAQADDPWQQ